MGVPLSQKSPATVLMSVAAAAGAFGVAAMMSAVTAPTASADAFSDVIDKLESQLTYDLNYGEFFFNAAETDFASNDVSDGLANLTAGVDEYGLSVPQNFVVLTAEAAGGISHLYEMDVWSFDPVTSFSQGLSDAQVDIAAGQSDLATALQDFAAGDFGDGAFWDAYATDYLSVIPLEEILLGAASSL
jgi:hypothetical protein